MVPLSKMGYRQLRAEFSAVAGGICETDPGNSMVTGTSTELFLRASLNLAHLILRGHSAVQ